MWERKELKERAKVALKANYWKSVLVGIFLSFIIGGSFVSTSNEARTNSDELVAKIESLDSKTFFTFLGIFFGVIALALVCSLVVQIFVWNPLEVGCRKFYLECANGENPRLGVVAWGFKNHYGKIGFTMFLRTLFISLWTLLFVIPGIIKTYEYLMVPYILSEHPDMDRKEVFARSKAMMDGNKWNTFVLDFSFFGWAILGAITCGIGEIFFVFPYIAQTQAQLYRTLKEQGK